jgi:hypothetical protein
MRARGDGTSPPARLPAFRQADAQRAVAEDEAPASAATILSAEGFS